MPFLGTPLSFFARTTVVVEGGVGRLVFADDPQLLVRFRPTSFTLEGEETVDDWDDENHPNALTTLLGAYAYGLSKDAANQRPQISAAYWKMEDRGFDGINRLGVLTFLGRKFNDERDMAVELKRNLHNAFVEQCLVQLHFDLDAGAYVPPRNRASLLLRLRCLSA
jgi:hypothetical protein